jgi:hypothetical protein
MVPNSLKREGEANREEDGGRSWRRETERRGLRCFSYLTRDEIWEIETEKKDLLSKFY